MIGSTRQLRVFALGGSADMRKGFDGLFALVSGLGRDVLAGDLHLFVSRARRRAKVLFWDGTGLVIYAKRLERGRFTALWDQPAEAVLQLTQSELALFLEGSKFAGKIALSPPPFTPGAARVAR